MKEANIPVTDFVLSHLSMLFRLCHPDYGLSRLWDIPWYKHAPPPGEFVKPPWLEDHDQLLSRLLDVLIKSKSPELLVEPDSPTPGGFKPRSVSVSRAFREVYIH